MSGGLCWVATVPRLDICARSAKIASRINFFHGSDVYRISDPARAALERQRVTASRFASSFRPQRHIDFSGKAADDMCNREGELHCRTT